MAKVLIVAEQRDGRLKKTTFELIGASASSGNDTHVLVLGDGIDGLAKELGHYGANMVHIANHASLKFYTAEAYAQVIVSLAKTLQPDVLLAAHSPTGRDLMPKVSYRLGVGLASDCVQATLEEGS